MSRGRPREFDPERALDAALELFWRQGYEGTSVAALAEAMGVGIPSLYAAFGSKRELFQKVLERYLQKPASYLARALQEPTARSVAEQALSGALEMVMDPRHPDGCLLVHGALASGPAANSIRTELSQWRAKAELAVCRRLERALRDGELEGASDPAQLARFLMTVIWGLSVQAAGGASRAQLEEVAQLALQCWPAEVLK